MKLSTSAKYLFVIFLISGVLFYPSLKVFYTHDDFFLLKISRIETFGQFLNFFNLIRGPEGLGMYRPLGMQTFYLLGWKLFNLNPFWLHLIAFLTLFTVIYLVYKLIKILTGNEKIGLTAAFLYAVSASHFAHLYALGTYVELLVTLFALLSCISFIHYIKTKSLKGLIITFLYFLGGLFSKETFVIIPLLLFLIYLYFVFRKKKVLAKPKDIFLALTPFFATIAIYFLMRFKYFGFPEGDSYVWVFSFRVFNTLFWYFLWALNLPEMLVDFVGPGLRFNPNLFKFYSREIIPIFSLFVVQLLLILYFFINWLRKNRNQKLATLFFGLGWFAISLAPVIFLPLHKFTYYLTLPLIGVVLSISILLENTKSVILKMSFLATWLLLSILTLGLTSKTHWITQGARIAEKVHHYLVENQNLIRNHDEIVFYDTDKDKNLPWKPSEILKVVLSDQNYFKVFWNDKVTAMYYNSEDKIKAGQIIKIGARDFLGY